MLKNESTPIAGEATGAKSCLSGQPHLASNYQKSQTCGACAYFRAVPTQRSTRLFCAFLGDKLAPQAKSCQFFTEVPCE